MATEPVFYLGSHIDGWLNHVGVPLFISNRRLARRKTLPKARMGWALDSGGFSELSLYSGWRTKPEEYVAAVKRYDREIGNLDWASPMDWMCEDSMLAKPHDTSENRDVWDAVEEAGDTLRRGGMLR